MIQRQFPARAVILICPYLVKPSTFPSIFKRRERWNCYNNEIKGFFISSLSLRFCESDEINTQHESLIDWIMELIMDNIYIYIFFRYGKIYGAIYPLWSRYDFKLWWQSMFPDFSFYSGKLGSSFSFSSSRSCEFSYSNVWEIILFTSGLYYPSELEFYNRIYPYPI